MKKKLYKTQILVEFISEYPINSDSDMSSLINEAENGDLSMRTTDKLSNKVIKGKQAVKALDEHGTDNEFFGIDSEGNEIE